MRESSAEIRIRGPGPRAPPRSLLALAAGPAGPTKAWRRQKKHLSRTAALQRSEGQAGSGQDRPGQARAGGETGPRDYYKAVLHLRTMHRAAVTIMVNCGRSAVNAGGSCCGCCINTGQSPPVLSPGIFLHRS